jgi:hypothetical protein
MIGQSIQSKHHALSLCEIILSHPAAFDTALKESMVFVSQSQQVCENGFISRSNSHILAARQN